MSHNDGEIGAMEAQERRDEVLDALADAVMEMTGPGKKRATTVLVDVETDIKAVQFEGAFRLGDDMDKVTIWSSPIYMEAGDFCFDTADIGEVSKADRVRIRIELVKGEEAADE